MFKKSIALVVVLMMVFITGCNSSKYDKITESKRWIKYVETYNKVLSENYMLKNYLDAVVSKKVIEDLIDGGTLEAEKSTFIKSHKSDFRKCLAIELAMVINNNRISMRDAEYVYVTGVLNGTKPMVAKNSMESEIERNFNSQMTGMKVATIFRENSSELSSKLIDMMYKNI